MRFGKYNELYITTGMSGNSVYDFDPSPGTYTLQGSGLAVVKYMYPNTIPTNVIKNKPNGSGFMLNPNPSDGRIILNAPRSAYYEISDMVGKTVKKIKAEAGANEINLNLETGIYIIRNLETNQMQKLIIK